MGGMDNLGDIADYPRIQASTDRLFWYALRSEKEDYRLDITHHFYSYFYACAYCGSLNR